MRILQICNKSPFPPKEGGSMAMHTLTRMLLSQGHEVKVLAINSSKCFVPENEIPASYKEQTGFEGLYVDTSLRFGPALKALIRNESYHAVRFYNKDFEARLTEILRQGDFDIVQLETVYPAVYLQCIRNCSKAKIIVRAHNIEHKIWERIAAHTADPFKRLYLRILSKQLRTFEAKVLQQADGIECISPIDADYFQLKGISAPICTIPFGFAAAQLQAYKPDISVKNNLYSLASMNWRPNIEGIQWFLKKCWPLIRKEFPDMEFLIAGRSLRTEDFTHAAKGVHIVGEVPDAESFMQENGLLIVPLLSGSGVRIKILEGMSLGKTIITTSIGAEGIKVCHKENILIADTPKAFAEAVSYCFTYPENCRRIGEKARKFVLEEYAEDHIAEKLTRFLQQILNTENHQ